VLDVSPVTGTVTVGPAERLDVVRLWGADPRWCGPAPRGPIECAAQIRAHGDAVDCVASLDGARVVVELRRPIRGVATGQAVVLYDGATVIGSATITATA
jgi:tRNA-specific 2-thiouridylase